VDPLAHLTHSIAADLSILVKHNIIVETAVPNLSDTLLESAAWRMQDRDDGWQDDVEDGTAADGSGAVGAGAVTTTTANVQQRRRFSHSFLSRFQHMMGSASNAAATTGAASSSEMALGRFYRFASPALQDLVYSHINSFARQKVHSAMAIYLEKQFAWHLQIASGDIQPDSSLSKSRKSAVKFSADTALVVAGSSADSGRLSGTSNSANSAAAGAANTALTPARLAQLAVEHDHSLLAYHW